MVSFFLFVFHLFFAVYIFYKKKKEGLSTAFLNLALIAVLFAVGWSITGIIANLVMEPEGFGKEFNRDTFSLVLLTLAEIFFYKFYYADIFTSNGKGKQ